MRKPRALSHAIALVAAAVAVSGCASSPYSGQVEPNKWTVVEVTNRNWSDVKIYAIRGTSKFRLGSVHSFSTQRLRVPEVAVASHEMRLRVEVIGSRAAYTTEPLLIDSGATVAWVINTHLPLSSLAIRR